MKNIPSLTADSVQIFSAVRQFNHSQRQQQGQKAGDLARIFHFATVAGR